MHCDGIYQRSRLYGERLAAYILCARTWEMQGSVFPLPALSEGSPAMSPYLSGDISIEWLVNEARNGDQQAANQLFGLFYRKICKFFLRDVHVSIEVAEEMTQDTFEKAWRHLPTLKDSARFESWLYTIATNISRDYGRKIRRRKVPIPLEHDFDMMDSAPLVENQVLARMHISEMLDTMPIKHRECLHLYYIENFTMEEIAVRMRLNGDSVKAYISKARVRLREELYQAKGEQDDVESKRRRGQSNGGNVQARLV
jgi:RNA polymerase sigma-70 factor, ECF subfamily